MGVARYGVGLYGVDTYGTEIYEPPAPTLRVPVGLAQAELTVRLAALDGTWEVGGADRARGVTPENVTLTANDWGPDTCRFTLRRDPGAIFPDLGAFTPCDVEVAGVVVWSGFVWETPTQEGADAQITVEGRGWQYHLDDDLFQRSYVHARLSDWVDSRSMPTCALANFFAAPQVTTDARLITIQVPNGTVVPASGHAGVTLDFGESANGPTRVVVDWESSNNGGAQTLYARASDSQNPTDTSASSDPISAVSLAAASGISAGTITTRRRYLHVFTFKSAGATYAADVWVRIKAIRCFRETAYESSNESTLKSSDVVRDALSFAPLLSTDRSLVQSTALSLPDFSMSDLRTPREAWEAANAPHRWVRKIGADRRPVFAPQPTVPKLRVGQWAGIEFKDASRNAGQEIYNRAAVVGTGPDGAPLRVTRHAAHLADTPVQPATAQTFPNPSFTTDASSWTATGGFITRVTVVAHSAPASGHFSGGVAGAKVSTVLGGTFKRGVAYVIRGRYYPLSAGASVRLTVGSETDFGETIAAVPASVFTGVDVVWIPRADITSPTFAAHYVNADYYIDSMEIFVAAPTLVDRRGFARTKVVSLSPTTNPAVSNSFGDALLASHKRTPLKGGFEATGPAVRTWLGDAPVHPSHLLLYTTELVHLSHHVDPDTGHLGRDAPIAAVTYDHDEERAQVDVDASRENFEALVERFNIFSG